VRWTLLRNFPQHPAVTYAPFTLIFQPYCKSMVVCECNCSECAICIEYDECFGYSEVSWQPLPRPNHRFGQFRVCFVRRCGDSMNRQWTQKGENQYREYRWSD